MRIQDREEETVLKAKARKSRLTRERMRLPISRKAYRLLSKLAGGEPILRRIYYLPGRPKTTVWVYWGKLSGLVRAEVGFASEAAARRFRKPGWMEQEITGTRLGSNRELYLMTRREFLRELARFLR